MNMDHRDAGIEHILSGKHFLYVGNRQLAA